MPARTSIVAMSPKLTARILIALSLCYGIAIAILGAVNSSAVGTVAVIGAVVIGALWALRGVLTHRGDT
jgi:hypothetical protein